MSQNVNDKPIIVKALHAYVPVNNDELRLEKGDIITVSQKEEGGWWEGTLNCKTGWFPSNYVEDHDPGQNESNKTAAVVQRESLQLTPQQVEYRKMILNEIIESETSHIKELKGLWENFLFPLTKYDILTATEYKVLIGNILEIEAQTSNLLNQIKSEETKPHKEQRIGKIFLENGPKMEAVHKNYCSNHPKAVQVIEKHKDALSSYMEKSNATSPGILVLVMGLSQPFRRLEKYPTMLQELERHVEEFHKDKGDLQRSIEFFKDLEMTCGNFRKQKEMELEVLSGAIKNWEGTDVTQLGEILFMNLVFLGQDRTARYFVLFSSNTLLILSYNSERNSLFYEGKIPISGITLRSLNTDDHAFEIAGPMIETIYVSCSSKSYKENWIHLLNKILKTNRFPSFGCNPQSFGQLAPPVQAWNIARLRPNPPYNPFLAESLDKNPNNPKGGNFTQSVTNDDDILILSLVDAFCSKNRQVSVVSTAPVNLQAKNQENEKQSGRNNALQGSMSEIVLVLRDEVTSLKTAMAQVSSQLIEEEKARKALQTFVQNHTCQSENHGKS